MMNNSCETSKSCRERLVLKLKGMIPEIIGLFAGGIVGFIYYKTVGCSSGSCTITSNPWLSVIWGSMIGYLSGSIFNKKKKK
jgi:hypothetical protein